MSVDDGFVTVSAKATGKKQRVPRHWLGVPSIAEQFKKTPRQRKADERTSAGPSEPVATTPDASTPDDVTPETPAAGDQKE